jgi:hypothetical protein
MRYRVMQHVKKDMFFRYLPRLHTRRQADRQDYRSENLVVENVGHALQKRTFRKGQKRNKRKEEGRANASCKLAGILPRLKLTGSVSWRRGGMAQATGFAADVEATSPRA